MISAPHRSLNISPEDEEGTSPYGYYRVAHTLVKATKRRFKHYAGTCIACPPVVRSRRISCVFVAVIALACKSDQAKEQERVDKALSWVATAGSVAKGWVDNRLPVRYVERTLEEAQAELTKVKEPEPARVTGQMMDAVRRRDREAVAAPLGALNAQWSRLHAQSEQLKSKSE